MGFHSDACCSFITPTKFLTAIALISLLTIPALESANAALVSPSSPAFGDNGY
jgi:hypothetical protein